MIINLGCALVDIHIFGTIFSTINLSGMHYLYNLTFSATVGLVWGTFMTSLAETVALDEENVFNGDRCCLASAHLLR